MLKKSITYTDYNGVSRTETHYFNLSKAELMEMEYSTSGGMAEMMQRIIDAQDGPTLMKIFKEVILKAYGIKSPDGKRFEKSEEISTAFSQTEAYSELYVELLSDSEKAAEFFNGILPANMEQHANAPAIPSAI